jgi:carboxylesterase type B
VCQVSAFRPCGVSCGMLLSLVGLTVLFANIDYAGGEWFGSGKQEGVVVETPYGKIAGTSLSDVNVYLGIPYAEAPTGRLRFRPPRRKARWFPATYQAMTYAPECLQSTLYYPTDDISATTMSEDCLYLNIWQPISARETFINRYRRPLLPVLVWIYGGAFLHGSANRPEYDGSKLATKGTGSIIVSLNYRLGALGFLVSTEDGLYGNYGLDDQKMAIQWVKENIVYFGGDPDRITLFGESAGAMSIGLHMLDQQHGYSDTSGGGNGQVSGNVPRRHSANERSSADKLFHAVIMQSNPLGYK